jgi:hypothetical protein
MASARLVLAEHAGMMHMLTSCGLPLWCLAGVDYYEILQVAEPPV